MSEDAGVQAPAASGEAEEPSRSADGAAEASSRPDSESPQLRDSWLFACTIQFARVFGTQLRIKPFPAEALEQALLHPYSHQHFLGELFYRLLAQDGGAGHAGPAPPPDLDKWEGWLHDRVAAMWASTYESNPLEELSFFEVQPGTRLSILYHVCEWRINDCHHLKEVIKRTAEDPNLSVDVLRAEPVGEDGRGGQYFFFSDGCEDCWLYRQEPPRAPKPGSKKHAGKVATGAEADPPETWGDARWEAVCTSLEEFSAFVDELGSSRNRSDKALHDALADSILPRLVETAAARRRAEEKAAKLEAMPRKRSSRLQQVASRKELEEEQRRREAEERSVRRAEEERKRKDAEREARLKARIAAEQAFVEGLAPKRQGPDESREERLAKRMQKVALLQQQAEEEAARGRKRQHPPGWSPLGPEVAKERRTPGSRLATSNFAALVAAVRPLPPPKPAPVEPKPRRTPTKQQQQPKQQPPKQQAPKQQAPKQQVPKQQHHHHQRPQATHAELQAAQQQQQWHLHTQQQQHLPPPLDVQPARKPRKPRAKPTRENLYVKPRHNYRNGPPPPSPPSSPEESPRHRPQQQREQRSMQLNAGPAYDVGQGMATQQQQEQMMAAQMRQQYLMEQHHQAAQQQAQMRQQAMQQLVSTLTPQQQMVLRQMPEPQRQQYLMQLQAMRQQQAAAAAGHPAPGMMHWMPSHMMAQQQPVMMQQAMMMQPVVTLPTQPPEPKPQPSQAMVQHFLSRLSPEQRQQYAQMAPAQQAALVQRYQAQAQMQAVQARSAATLQQQGMQPVGSASPPAQQQQQQQAVYRMPASAATSMPPQQQQYVSQPPVAASAATAMQQPWAMIGNGGAAHGAVNGIAGQQLAAPVVKPSVHAQQPVSTAQQPLRHPPGDPSAAAEDVYFTGAPQ